MVSSYQLDLNYFDSWTAFDSAIKKFATRGYLHKRISLQSHKTLLPRGLQVNTKKLIHVLKTCRLCHFISDNQNTTLDVLRLSLFSQEKQTKNAAEITVK